MNYEVKGELNRLKEMVENGQIAMGNLNMFFDKTYYDDDYSGNEIFEMQDEFLYHAKAYLKEKHSGKYAIQHGSYAVIVITKEHFDNIAWKIGWAIC